MDWTITLISSVIGSLLLSVIGNLLTDPVKKMLSNRSMASRRRNLSDLRKGLTRITELYQDRQKLYLEFAISTT